MRGLVPTVSLEREVRITDPRAPGLNRVSPGAVKPKAARRSRKSRCGYGSASTSLDSSPESGQLHDYLDDRVVVGRLSTDRGEADLLENPDAAQVLLDDVREQWSLRDDVGDEEL